MVRFVNISAKENSPCLVNADEISVIHESASGNDIFIFLKSGERISVGRDQAGLAFGQCAKKLAQNGLSLFPVSVAERGRFFINPAAFTYLDINESRITEKEVKPHVWGVIGAEGYGALDARMSARTVEKLLDAVRQEEAPLARIDKDKVLHPEAQPAYAVYDPRKITSVEENCGFIHVHFALSGYVNFDVRSLEFHAAYQAYGNKIRVSSGTQVLDFSRKLEGRLRREFARKVARDAPDLVRLEGAQNILYTRFNDVSRITMHAGEGPDKKSVVMVFYPKDSPNCTGQSHKRGFYDTPEAAQKEMARLQTLLGEPS